MSTVSRSTAVRAWVAGLLVTGAVVALAGARPAAAGSEVRQVPTSIQTTCSASSPDVTAQLQAWLASVPDGDVASLAHGACYHVEGTLLLDRRKGLTVEGNGAMIRSFTDGHGSAAAVAARRHVWIRGGSDVTIKDLSVVGNDTAHRYVGPAYEDQAGFWLSGVQGATLQHVSVLGVHGDFVYIGPDTDRTWKWSSDVVVTGSTFRDSGRQGVAVTGAQRVLVEDDSFVDAALSTFDVEPDSGTGPTVDGVPTYGGANAVTIAHNTVGRTGTVFLSDDGNARVTALHVVDNTLHGQPFVLWSTGSAAVPRRGLVVSGNTSDTAFASPRAAFELTYQQGAVISGNHVPLTRSRKMTAVLIAHSTGVRVVGNAFPGATTVVTAPASSTVSSGNVTR